MADVFGGEDNPNATVRAEDLVGEGKKFKSVDDLARGKAEADAYIERLKTEKAEADRKASEASNAAAELAALREEIAAMKQARPSGEQPVQPSQPEVKDLDALIEQSITRAEQRRTQKQNIDEANRVVTEHFSGDSKKAGEEVAKRAREMGLTIDDLKGLAARSPTAFKALIVGEAPAQPPVNANLLRSTVAPSAAPLNVSGPKPGTKEFYNEMLRKEPQRYMTREVQERILKDTLAGTYIPD